MAAPAHRYRAELHLHSCWSLLDGASSPDELILRARDLGYETLALTDHDGLYGSMEFAQAARAFGIRAITGAEVTLEDGHHLTLLARDSEGYGNLCRLLSTAHLTSARKEPRLSLAALAQHTRGLIALSGCKRGLVPALVAAGEPAAAEAAVERYIALFGRENFYVELQQNLVHGDTERCRRLVALAQAHGLRYVATNDVHYHERARHRLQDVMVAIRHRTTLEASHRERRENSEYYLKSPEEMAELFAAWPEALDEGARIAERCTFDLTRDLEYRFPDYTPPDGSDADAYLETVCRQAARERYGSVAGRIPERVKRRLQEELRLVRKHGLSGFFLIYRELLELSREVAAEVRGGHTARSRSGLPPGRGRGSSVGSILCYLIGLSHVDPIKHNLYLGRFLNDEIASVPDIDLDFPRDIREQLILRVYEHFGREHAALVASFPTYKLRSAIRDVGKALGIAESELDRLAKRAGWGSAGDIAHEMSLYDEYAGKIDAPIWRDLIALAQQISGFPRHLSQHVGGMVISTKPIVELVPVEQAAMAGRYICQWDKDSVDDARFIKIDFLALGMLSLVEECADLIAEQHGRIEDLSRIDFGDPEVYDLICAADTVGVFQIESRAQMQMLPRTRPRSIEDLTVQVAIIRPGPIVGGAVNPYVRHRQAQLADPGFRPPYDHPSLEPVLSETLGVILYQEQVLQAAVAVAGFTEGQAEALRRAMSRKRSRDNMARFYALFRDGARARGVSDEVAKTVFEKIVAFAEFGFPKSHSAAFAFLAFQSAWLRRYYPVEFLCSLLNAQPMGFYPPHVLVHDARRHGVTVLPPDINAGAATCSVEHDAVRVGFGYVRGIGAGPAQAIVDERARGGPFASLADFVRRICITPIAHARTEAGGWRRLAGAVAADAIQHHKRAPALPHGAPHAVSEEAIENLIQTGAFDAFGLNRREMLWQLGLLYRPPHVQLTLPLPIAQDSVRLEDMTTWEQMAADYNLLSLSPGHHPMALMRPAIGEAMPSLRHLLRMPDGERVRVPGMVVCRQQPGTAKGFVFLLMEDEFGMLNIIVPPWLHERQRALVRGEPFVIVAGTLQRKEGTVNLLAERFEALPVPQARRAAERLRAPTSHNFG
ncbi:MAG: DNA polymerase III subunit alpha [Dehalococcoidia bacterium]|nr:DNA polymerase III subunit alpha [Dehalococcoidia bacterium]